MLKTDKQKRFKATVLALMLAVAPLGSYAAGLGRLTVSSALGQPLRAEIDLTASREEISSLSARLASGDAFKNAGIEYTQALSAIRFAVERRPNGQVYLLVTSDRPFTEPFVDMLVEVNWASGRLVREYTFLLDPPDVLAKPVPVAPVALPEAKKEATPTTRDAVAPAVEPKLPQPQRDELPASAAEKPAPQPKKAAAESATAGAPTRLVQKGDTLAKIANELRPAGVNLDQMLVALFRSNQEVFDGGNMNRLRAGKILNVPDKDAAPAVEPGEARRIVVAQAADFNAYRKKLAALAGATPAQEEAPKQAVAGKITPKVEEKAPPVAAGDKLEVSRAATTGKDGKAGARISAMEEDMVARAKALNEANSRIAELEKNLADLRKLAEMKSAAAGKAPEAPATKPAEAPKPAPALAVPAQPAPVEKPTETPPPAPKPVEAPKPVVLPVAPPPPPSFVEANPEIVFGGGAIVALLLGYLGFNVWRRKRQAADSNAGVADAEFSSNSVFGATEGQGVDTDVALPTDFSREGMGSTAGDEGVDPVAEAEVYMAYGRDKQAEEILLEALKTDPTRTAIHLKLLEIYAARKSVQPFGAVARDLHGLTGGTGPDWAKAVALGLTLDPTNPLFGAPGAGGDGMAETVIVQSPLVAPAQDDGAPVAVEMEPAVEAPMEEPPEEIPASLDFDLDLGTEPAAEAVPAEQAAAPDEVLSLDFDLDLGATPAAEPPAETPGAAASESDVQAVALDFDLGADAATEESIEPAVEAPAAEVAAASPAADEVAALDFDFDLGHEAPVEAQTAAAPEPEMPLDLSSISLELDETPPPAVENVAVVDLPAAEAPPAAVELALPELAVETVMADNPEVATKLELAQAYEEMGDKEGARELLNEVLNEGSPGQREAARAKLDQLA